MLFRVTKGMYYLKKNGKSEFNNDIIDYTYTGIERIYLRLICS